MSVTYVNVFRAGQKTQAQGSTWDTPQWAQLCHRKCNHRRVEMRINGHWLKPPVGLRAEEASHEWRERLVSPYGVMPFVFEDQLEPRT